MLESNMSCFEQKYEMPGIPVSDGVLCGMFMVVTIEKKAKKFGLFLLSLYLCAEIESMINAFWWGNNKNNHRGIRWISWDGLCVLKSHSGMGFCKIHDF